MNNCWFRFLADHTLRSWKSCCSWYRGSQASSRRRLCHSEFSGLNSPGRCCDGCRDSIGLESGMRPHLIWRWVIPQCWPRLLFLHQIGFAVGSQPVSVQLNRPCYAGCEDRTVRWPRSYHLGIAVLVWRCCYLSLWTHQYRLPQSSLCICLSSSNPYFRAARFAGRYLGWLQLATVLSHV